MTFTTTFPMTNQFPISEDGFWQGGLTVGLDWTDVRVTNSYAYSTEDPQSSGFDDSTAILKGTWNSNQAAQATIVVKASDANTLGEVELRLNSTISNHWCSGYEGYVSIKPGNAYVHIARWNGVVNSYANIETGNINFYGKTGDILSFTNTAGSLKLYLNGTNVCSATDTNFPAGAPGMGFFNSSGVIGHSGEGNTNFGFSKFTATDSIRPETNNISADVTSFTNAWFKATNADTILIRSGSFTNQIVTNSTARSFTVRGFGTNNTAIYSPVGAPHVFYVPVDATNYFFQFADFAAHEDTNTSGFIDSAITNLICTNLWFPENKYRGIQLVQGLVTHCYFNISPVAGSFNSVSFQGLGYQAYTNANPMATHAVACVEYCYFKNTNSNGGNGFFDGYKGCQALIRYCTFDGGAYNGIHGYDSQIVGNRSLEVYGCVFTNQNLNSPVCLTRGSEFLYYSNDTYAANGFDTNALNPQLQYYRGCQGSYQGWYGYPGVAWSNDYSAITFTDGYVLADAVKWGLSVNYTAKTALDGTKNEFKIGANLAETLTNLAAAINLGAGSGTKYTASTERNPDCVITNIGLTYLIGLNIQDGTNGAYQWPAAFGMGIWSTAEYTNNQVSGYPCYSWSNRFFAFGSSTPVPQAFILRYGTDSCGGVNNITNLMKEGRDFVNNSPPSGYVPIAAPYVFGAADGSAGTGSALFVFSNGGGGGGPSSPTPTINAGSAYFQVMRINK